RRSVALGLPFVSFLLTQRCKENNLKSSCADLIRVSTSLLRPPKGADGSSPRLSRSASEYSQNEAPRLSVQPAFPLAGLGPATHVFERGCMDCRKGVGDRDKLGQGNPELFPVGVNNRLLATGHEPVRHDVRPIRRAFSASGLREEKSWTAAQEFVPRPRER